MSRSLGPRLPQALVERFSQRDLEKRLGVAVPLVTVDAEQRPHPMLLSYLEIRAHDAGTVGLVILAKSQSARNLTARQTATLVVIEPDATWYVKLRALDGPLPVPGGEAYGLGYFLLAVEDVLEDAAAEWEGGMRITGAVTYAPPPRLNEPWAEATLRVLMVPHATS
jgi:Pyridoxamine 5'-phosphate oxidase